MKKFWTVYFSPTPIVWRALGDSLLYGGGMIITYYVGAKLNSDAWIAIALVIVGKFLTNIFQKKGSQPTNTETQ